MSIPVMIVVFAIAMIVVLFACVWLMFEETNADRAFRNEYKKQLAELDAIRASNRKRMADLIAQA